MEKYRVNFNETLDDIAKKYDLSIDELIKANDFLSDKLFDGQLINIPVNKKSLIKYIIKKGDTLDNLSKEHNIDLEILTKINGLEENEYLYENDEILMPNNDVKLYLTKNNDVLNDILDKEKVKLESFFKNNKLIYLLPEQLLIIKK